MDEMEPEMSVLLAGRLALESLPPTERRSGQQSVNRTRTLARLLMGVVNDVSRVRSGTQSQRTPVPSDGGDVAVTQYRQRLSLQIKGDDK
jgi:hypothetical protein